MYRKVASDKKTDNKAIKRMNGQTGRAQDRQMERQFGQTGRQQERLTERQQERWTGKKQE